MEQHRSRLAKKPQPQPCSDSNRVLGSSRKTQKREITLPSEIICQILIKLTVDHLRNCMSVCKSWNSLIKSEHFVLSHLELRSSIEYKKTRDMNVKDDLILVHVMDRVKNPRPPSGGEVLTLDCDNDKNKYTESSDVIKMSGTRIAVSSIYGAREFSMEYLSPNGYRNGIICAVDRRDHTTMLWNPCIRKIFVLPRPTIFPGFRNFYLLGYDSHNKDFKVMHISEQSRGLVRFEVFSLHSGSWKDLNAPQFVFKYVTAKEICGAFHWICLEHRPNSKKMYTAVVSFNLSTDSFKQMEVPNKLRKREPWGSYVVSYRESFAILSKRKRRPWIVDLWVMNEYGVGESWTKVMKIWYTEFSGDPVYFRKNGEIMHGTLGGIEIFDPERKKVKCLGDIYGVSLMYPFFASLVLLDRADAFLY